MISQFKDDVSFSQEAADITVRKMIDKVAVDFDKKLKEHEGALRRSVIHNDGNDQNLVFMSDAPDILSAYINGFTIGLIDFGDLVHTYLVGEIAICMTYLLADQVKLLMKQVLQVTGLNALLQLSSEQLFQQMNSNVEEMLTPVMQVLRGYSEILPLNQAEKAVLKTFMCMRMAVSICVAANGLRKTPDDEYLKLHSVPAKIAIKLLDLISEDSFWNCYDVVEKSHRSSNMKVFQGTAKEMTVHYWQQSLWHGTNKSLRALGSDQKTTLLFLHGAGQTSVSWKPLVAALERMYCKATTDSGLDLQCFELVAFDCRGHGRTSSKSEHLPIKVLVEDALAFLQGLLCTTAGNEAHRVILVGHSMGGAVAVKLAATLAQSAATEEAAKIRVIGVALLESVGDTALDAIQKSKEILFSRPTTFLSIEEVRQFAGLSEMRDPTKLEILFSQLYYHPNEKMYKWRTALLDSAEHWPEWFEKVSSTFLDLRMPGKLILVAHIDRLDTPLTLGHMQGKFQLVVVQASSIEASHFVHESKPMAVANRLFSFVNRITQYTMQQLLYV